MRYGFGIAVFAALTMFGVQGVQAAGNADAGKQKAATCMACHGADGNSPNEMWPKIAGQLPQYIQKQLQDFKYGRRKNEQMSPMAQPLTEQDILDLAAYFGSQKAGRLEQPKNAAVALGEKIYMKGKGRPDAMAACVGCHGLNATGKADWSATMKVPPTTLAPALASQYPAYTSSQLKAYKTGARNNDIAQVMRDITSKLTQAEMDAVAAYLGTIAR